jgi:predicted Na+-dependent transporter
MSVNVGDVAFCVCDLAVGNVDLEYVMKPWRCTALANMRNRGLKLKAQAESKYKPGSMMVQLISATLVPARHVSGHTYAAIRDH